MSGQVREICQKFTLWCHLTVGCQTLRNFSSRASLKVSLPTPRPREKAPSSPVESSLRRGGNELSYPEASASEDFIRERVTSVGATSLLAWRT